jgi:3-dehydroquinate dehydratase
VIAPYVTGTIQGFGRAGYHLAIVAAAGQLPPR